MQRVTNSEAGLTKVLPWNDELLDQMRRKADPAAAAIIDPIIDQGKERIKQISEIFDLLSSTHSQALHKLPSDLQAYFSDSQLPDWADADLIKRGEHFFNRLGPICVLALIFKALPECYAGAKGAEVLYSTGRLNGKRGHPEALSRRIAETAQFILNVMAPGGMQGGGKGVTTAKKIRLIHQSIRHYITFSDFDVERFGEPINQEDLAGTMLAFSVATLDGMDMLGFTTEPEEKEAYYHAWRIVGHFIGIEDQLLPARYEDAANLWAAIQRRQYAPSEAGEKLTEALLGFLTQNLPTAPDESFPRHLLRFLVGDRVADMLAVPPVEDVDLKTLLQIVRRMGRPIEKTVEHHEVIGEIAEFSSRWLMESFVHRWNQGKKVHFDIPPSLRKDWKIRTRWDDRVVVVGPIMKYRLAIEREESSLDS